MKKIKIYMVALQSPGGLGYTLDDVYCFATEEQRSDWLKHNSNNGYDVTCLEDEIEI